MKTFRTAAIEKLVEQVALELADKLGGNLAIFKREALKSIERSGMSMDSVIGALQSMATAWYVEEEYFFPLSTLSAPTPVSTIPISTDPLRRLTTIALNQELAELCVQLPGLFQAINEPQDIGRQKAKLKKEIEILEKQILVLEAKGKAATETSKNAKVEYHRINQRCDALRRELERHK